MYIFSNCKAVKIVKTFETDSGKRLFQMQFINSEGETFNSTMSGLTRTMYEFYSSEYSVLKFRVSANVYRDVPQLQFWGPVDDVPDTGLDLDSVEFDKD